MSGINCSCAFTMQCTKGLKKINENISFKGRCTPTCASILCQVKVTKVKCKKQGKFVFIPLILDECS